MPLGLGNRRGDKTAGIVPDGVADALIAEQSCVRPRLLAGFGLGGLLNAGDAIAFPFRWLIQREQG